MFGFERRTDRLDAVEMHESGVRAVLVKERCRRLVDKGGSLLAILYTSGILYIYNMDNKNLSTRLAKYKSLLRSSRKDELKNPNSTSKVKIAMLKKNYSRKINDGKENY